jgi:heat shock protein HslJ
MKIFLKPLMFLALVLFAFGCKQNAPDNEEATTDEAMTSEQMSPAEAVIEHNDAYLEPAGEKPLGDNSRVSLDWAGTYQGIIPCDGCTGIKTRLTLNEDGTYGRSMSFIGSETEHVDQEGNYSWDNDGFVVTLEVPDGENQAYQVGEGRLIHIDSDGKHLNGVFADEYRLEKVFRDSELEDHTWVLVEMMNKPIDPDAGMKRAELTFISEEGLMAGNNSCNNVSASYVIRRAKGLSLGIVRTTMMACPDMSVADKMDEILEQANRYEIHQDTLSLDHDHMAPLARFVKAD